MTKEYVRVSDIIGHLQDFSKIDPKVLDAKAKLGTNVHAAIGQLVTGEFPYLESEKAVGYLRSYERWHAEHKPQYLRMEQRLYCDNLMITGQMDAIVSVGNDQHMLIDFKCSYKPSPDIWTLQAHFYHYLCKVNSIPTSNKMTWINLQKDGGKPKILTFEYSDDIMQKCIDMAHKFWEDRANAKTF